MSDEMKRIGELIRNQDNRITDQPIFIVQQKVKDYGYDADHSFDGYEWINPDNDHAEADERQAGRLDALAKGHRETAPWERVYFKERWDFVTACFTEQGCLDYMKRNGHNLKGPRIYADGSFRNEEYRSVRNFLMDLAAAEKDHIADAEGMVCECGADPAHRIGFKFCPYCGKPIKLNG